MLFKILTAPLKAPFAGLGFVLHTIQDLADQELYDVDRIRDDLLLLQARLDEGEITEEEYAEAEPEIMARLRAARIFRQQQAQR